MGEELEIVDCSSPLSWVLLAKERKSEEKRRKGRRKKRNREERKRRFQEN